MRDIIGLFDVEERSSARAGVDVMINAIQTLGGNGRAYMRERAKAARAVVAEIYSPPRVTAAARRLPKYGLEPGLALDITIEDDTGKPFDFSRRKQRQKVEAMIDARKPLLLIWVAYVHRILGDPSDQSCKTRSRGCCQGAD